MRSLFAATVLVSFVGAANGATHRDLQPVIAKVAAAAARALPRAKAEVSGTTALISRNIRRAPNEEFSRAHGVTRGSGYVEVPTDTGMMFVIRLFPGGPKLHLPLDRAFGEFDRRGAEQHMFYLKTTTIGHAEPADVTAIIEVLFGRATDDAELRQTYAAIKKSLIRELGE